MNEELCYYLKGDKCGVAFNIETQDYFKAHCPCADYQTEPDQFWEMVKHHTKPINRLFKIRYKNKAKKNEKKEKR